MAADRVPRRREGAYQILALDLAGRHRICGACGYCQIALAHRTRLSGTQAGGRARTFRRPRMARLPPPRYDVHRNLRLLGLRAGDDSPSGPRPARLFEELALPADYRPRGAAAADRAPHSKFGRHHAPTPDHRPRPAPVAMPVLSKTNASTFAAEKFVTQ